jgi:hypothetical protein
MLRVSEDQPLVVEKNNATYAKLRPRASHIVVGSWLFGGHQQVPKSRH